MRGLLRSGPRRGASHSGSTHQCSTSSVLMRAMSWPSRWTTTRRRSGSWRSSTPGRRTVSCPGPPGFAFRTTTLVGMTRACEPALPVATHISGSARNTCAALPARGGTSALLPQAQQRRRPFHFRQRGREERQRIGLLITRRGGASISETVNECGVSSRLLTRAEPRMGGVGCRRSGGRSSATEGASGKAALHDPAPESRQSLRAAVNRPAKKRLGGERLHHSLAVFIRSFGACV